jgi:hypothetical protein
MVVGVAGEVSFKINHRGRGKRREKEKNNLRILPTL